MKKLRMTYGDELLKNLGKVPEGKLKADYDSSKIQLILGEGDIEVEIKKGKEADFIFLPEEVYEELKVTDYEMDWCSVYLNGEQLYIEIF